MRRNVIRSELLAGCNNVLGGALVQEIYFTDFAILLNERVRHLTLIDG